MWTDDPISTNGKQSDSGNMVQVYKGKEWFWNKNWILRKNRLKSERVWAIYPRKMLH